MYWECIQPLCGLPIFIFLMVKFLLFIKSNLWVFRFMASIFCVPSEISAYPKFMKINSPVFSSKNFKGLDFMFRSLIHFKLIFLYAVRPRLFFSLQICSFAFLLKRIFISQWMTLDLLSKIRYHIYVDLFLYSALFHCFVLYQDTNGQSLYLITAL